jgi:hypothetical protein
MPHPSIPDTNQHIAASEPEFSDLRYPAMELAKNISINI